MNQGHPCGIQDIDIEAWTAGWLIADWQYLPGFFVSKGSNIIDGDIGGSVHMLSITRDKIEEVVAVESTRAWG